MIEKKIKELSDTDLETVYYLLQQDYEQITATADEIKNRKLLIEKVENIEDEEIKTLCKLEKYNDIQCMQMINQLNQTENINDYECVDFEYNEYDWNKDDYIYKDMQEEEKIRIYKQKCKYQLIKYLSKRLLSMPKGYLAMANISNKDGIFNEVIEMGLEDTELHIENEKDDENCI